MNNLRIMYQIQNLKKIFFLLPFLFCVCGIFYYSWLPNPSLATESYLPFWLRNWSNTYFNLRTAVPFIPLGYLLEVRIILSTGFRLRENRKIFSICSFIIALSIILIAEVGQFFIAQRHPDVMDVFFGVLGSLTGMVFYHLINLIAIKK